MTGRASVAQMAWPDLRETNGPLLVPLGALEQHGPHLPLDTDTRIAVAVAEAAAGTGGPDGGVLLAPPIEYGASGEHEDFAGTISLGSAALEHLLVEYGRSACRWASRLVFVNGHGGNGAPLASAVATLRYEGRDVAWFPCAVRGADAHAGDAETSVLLHLSPESVRTDQMSAGNSEPIGALIDTLRVDGVAAVSPNGVLGDPRGATAERGADLLAGVVADLAAALHRWTVDETGRLR